MMLCVAIRTKGSEKASTLPRSRHILRPPRTALLILAACNRCSCAVCLSDIHARGSETRRCPTCETSPNTCCMIPPRTQITRSWLLTTMPSNTPNIWFNSRGSFSFPLFLVCFNLYFFLALFLLCFILFSFNFVMFSFSFWGGVKVRRSTYLLIQKATVERFRRRC